MDSQPLLDDSQWYFKESLPFQALCGPLQPSGGGRCHLRDLPHNVSATLAQAHHHTVLALEGQAILVVVASPRP